MNQKLMNRLPTDIINHIIPYTYNLQNKDILSDIKNYVESKNEIFQSYQKNYYSTSEGLPWREYLFDIINDFLIIKSDTNEEKFCYFNFVLRRHLLLSNKSNYFIDDFSCKISVTTYNNMYWGLLTIDERNDILYYLKN